MNYIQSQIILNLKNYVNDIDYIYDEKKNITPQAKSDIIRLSLLKNYGGVWADATILCMQPLDHWIYDAIEPSGFWMYHGHGGGSIIKEIGPACWFIISKKNGYIINKWKEQCDSYWNINNTATTYYWLDCLFIKAFQDDEYFKELWLKTPFLYCELDGQSHTLSYYGMEKDTPYLKDLFLNKPPYVLKFWQNWDNLFPDVNSQDCKKSNGYFAIQISKRQLKYKHIMT